MTIQDWADIGQILSTLGLLVTLAYLAVQTKQNTDAVQASSRQAIVSGDIELLADGIAYPGIDHSMYKQELTDDEKVRLEWWLIGLCRTREYQWLQYRNGWLDRDSWESNLSALQRNLSFPRTRGWWKFVSDRYFDHSFVEEVNRHLPDWPVFEEYIHAFDSPESKWS